MISGILEKIALGMVEGHRNEFIDKMKFLINVVYIENYVFNVFACLYESGAGGNGGKLNFDPEHVYADPF